MKILSKSEDSIVGWACCVTPPLKDANGVCRDVDSCPLDNGDTVQNAGFSLAIFLCFGTSEGCMSSSALPVD